MNRKEYSAGAVKHSFDETDLFKDTFHEILIISPFLSGGVIRDFNDRNTQSLINDARYWLC